MCAFPDLNPSVTETTVHPLLSSESSKATRRLVLIRSPSPLSSLHPHPTTHAPFFFFFQRTAGGAAAGPSGHQTSHSFLASGESVTHSAVCAGHQQYSVATSRMQHCSTYSVLAACERPRSLWHCVFPTSKHHFVIENGKNLT